jgi:hypothetical protein
MSGSAGGGIQDTVKGAAERAASGAQGAADQVQRVVCGAACGIGEVRDAIRAQPITAAVVVFTLGYLLGSLIPSRRS